jgi:prepilin-type N-terminal cleavage/methylation domain-containing protein
VRHSSSKAKYTASGFTLIEVMIALAIFVVGALAIVRIFPPALSIIQGSESRSVAVNRSRAYLSRSTAQQGLIPDSIYEPLNIDGDNSNDFVGATVGTATRNKALPATLVEDDISGSALGKFKRIVGEKHQVLVDDSTTPPSRFVLSQFSHDAEDANNNVSIWVEDRVSGIRVNNNGDLDFTDAKLGIDGREFNERDYRYPNGTTPTRATLPNSERLAPDEWAGPNTVYYVTYRYVNDANGNNVVDTGERVQGVVDEPLILPTTTGAPASAVARLLAGRSPLSRLIIAGEIGVRVKRRIRDAIVATNAASAERDSIRGYVELANGSNDIPDDLQPAAGPATGLIYPTISLNYTVRDWRWLIDDDTPSPRSDTVQTPIRFYDSERLADDALGLEGENTTKPLIGLLLDIESDGTVTPRFGWWDQQLDQAQDALTRVERKAGEVTYDLDPPPTGSPRTRTAYWTLDGWAQQISVAARSYVPFYTNADRPTRPVDEPEVWREYYWRGAGASDNGVLYFPASEAGKSVLVSFEHWTGTEYRTQTSVVTIEDDLANSPHAGFGTHDSALGRRRVSVAEITDPESTTGAPYDVRAILAVRGLSVQSRTAWIENNARYTQAEAVGYRKLD